jgi:hypothetical protein
MQECHSKVFDAKRETFSSSPFPTSIYTHWHMLERVNMSNGSHHDLKHGMTHTQYIVLMVACSALQILWFVSYFKTKKSNHTRHSIRGVWPPPPNIYIHILRHFYPQLIIYHMSTLKYSGNFVFKDVVGVGGKNSLSLFLHLLMPHHCRFGQTNPYTHFLLDA